MKFRTFLVLALVAFAEAATAASKPVGISLQRPTTWSDGSALAASDITGYQVECQFTATGATSAVPCTLAGSPLAGGTSQGGSVTVTYPPIGGTACFVLRTIAAGGLLSDGSAPPACKALPALKPGDPTNVTVTITLAINIEAEGPVSVAMASPVVSRQ